jgi:hypothetical protein
LVAGGWLLVVGCWFWWLVTGGWLAVAGCWWLVAGRLAGLSTGALDFF